MALSTPTPIPAEIERVAHRLIVEGVIVEVKVVSRLRPIHTRQVVSHLKATHLRLGLLMNFNVNVLKDGTKRIIL
jgi:GxxExxY protein